MRDQFGGRLDYQMSEKQSMLCRYMRSDTDRTTPRVIAAVDQKALATLQDGLVSHNYVLALESHQPDARLDQPHHAPTRP